MSQVSNFIIKCIEIIEIPGVSNGFRKAFDTAAFRSNDGLPKPMELNEVHAIKLDFNQRKSCQLLDKQKKKVEKYYVKKILKGEQDWHFFASVDEDFTESSKSDFTEKNDDQIGYAHCSKALIVNVYVEDGDNGKLNARRCGIGTVLSVLCMIDEDVNPGEGIALNVDVRFLSYGQATIEKIKRECKKLVGLHRDAAEGGGNIYFEAALQAGYNRMILYDTERRELVWPDVKKAQQCYNEKRFGCYREYWYFCKEVVKSTQAPPVPPACLKPKPNKPPPVPNCPKPKKH